MMDGHGTTKSKKTSEAQEHIDKEGGEGDEGSRLSWLSCILP